MNFLPKNFNSLPIDRPTLIVDKTKVLRNIERMLNKAKTADVILRPHFKTHQSAEIGNWFHERGTHSITVSSLDMARYFADNGWADITVAFPVNLLELDKINSLAKKITLNLLVDSDHSVQEMGLYLNHSVNIWIKIDVGYHRVGIEWEDINRIISTVRMVESSRNIKFVGLLTHSGDSYNTKTTDEIRTIHRQSIARLLDVKLELEQHGIGQCYISIGDTPCCSIADSFEGINEIRPGNFVFYDLKQQALGSCSEEDIAVVVACPVVSKNRERNQIIIYGGAVHLSKDSLIDTNVGKVHGYVASCNDDTWIHIEKRASVTSLSQEHGVIQVDDDFFDSIAIGDILLVFPVHSCLTCDLYSEYKTLQGEIINRNRSNNKF